MNKYWKAIFGLVAANLKRFIRDKVSLFFTFLFPLIFLLIFGSIFNNQSISFKVAIINESDTVFAHRFVDTSTKDKNSPLKIIKVKDMKDAKEKMKRSAIDGIIVLPPDFGKVASNQRPSGTLSILYQKGSDQAGQTLSAIMTRITEGINKDLGHPAPPFKISSQAIGSPALTNFDYTFTGLLAFSLMSMGIFGLANILPAEKKRGTLRRLRAAPFTSGQLIIGTSVQFTIIAMLSVVTMLVAGLLIFGFSMRGNWGLFALFAVISSLMTIGFGLFIGGWARNENQAAVTSNLVSFPMMFLSGAFFPTFLFPEWLQVTTKFIPLTPVVDGFRLIMTENATFMEVAPQIGMVAAWIVVVYGLAIKFFRWEP